MSKTLTMQNVMDACGLWSDATFGSGNPTDPQSGLGSLAHLKEEVEELIENPNDIEEWADVTMLLLDAARRRGFTAKQLLQWTLAKLEINKTREWGVPDAEGIVRHIPNPQEAADAVE